MAVAQRARVVNATVVLVMAADFRPPYSGALGGKPAARVTQLASLFMGQAVIPNGRRMGA